MHSIWNPCIQGIFKMLVEIWVLGKLWVDFNMSWTKINLFIPFYKNSVKYLIGQKCRSLIPTKTENGLFNPILLLAKKHSNFLSCTWRLQPSLCRGRHSSLLTNVHQGNRSSNVAFLSVGSLQATTCVWCVSAFWTGRDCTVILDSSNYFCRSASGMTLWITISHAFFFSKRKVAHVLSWAHSVTEIVLTEV